MKSFVNLVRNIPPDMTYPPEFEWTYDIWLGYGPDTYFSQEQITQKQWKRQFLFATRCLDMSYPLVKIHKSIPYGSEITQTRTLAKGR